MWHIFAQCPFAQTWSVRSLTDVFHRLRDTPPFVWIRFLGQLDEQRL